jgi:hypothetical protein
MAVETPCQTPGAQFHTAISNRRIAVSVDLPGPLRLSAAQAAVLDANLHNALELVLAPYWAVVERT